MLLVELGFAAARCGIVLVCWVCCSIAALGSGVWLCVAVLGVGASGYYVLIICPVVVFLILLPGFGGFTIVFSTGCLMWFCLFNLYTWKVLRLYFAFGCCFRWL